MLQVQQGLCEALCPILPVVVHHGAETWTGGHGVGGEPGLGPGPGMDAAGGGRLRAVQGVSGHAAVLSARRVRVEDQRGAVKPIPWETARQMIRGTLGKRREG